MLRRILLSPFALLWGLVLRLRHALYDTGVLKSVRPSVPTIVIGNLSFGGTGKTPHVRLVVESLAGVGSIATLSRGYGGRVASASLGVREVREVDHPSAVGDEPLMLKRALPMLRVFVGADRVKAIEGIQRAVPDVKVVILDDAFQHRRLNAGLNILLTTWNDPYSDDALVPAGNLRDLKSKAKAAQVVVVTKCPLDTFHDRSEDRTGANGGNFALPYLIGEWTERLGLRPEQQLFFSGLEHGEPYFVCPGDELRIGDPLPGRSGQRPDRDAELRIGDPLPDRTGQRPDRDAELRIGDPPPGRSGQGTDRIFARALLVTGIADPKPLLDHARTVWGEVKHMAFPDHHAFTAADIASLARAFATFADPENGLIVTTEKDAVRLLPMIEGSALANVPIAVVPAKAVILNDPHGFDALLREHLAPDPAHR